MSKLSFVSCFFLFRANRTNGKILAPFPQSCTWAINGPSSPTPTPPNLVTPIYKTHFIHTMSATPSNQLNQPNHPPIQPPNTVLVQDMPSDLLAKVTAGLEKITDRKELVYLQAHLKYALAAYYTSSTLELETAQVDNYKVTTGISDYQILEAKGTDFAGFIGIANDLHIETQFIVMGFRGTISLSNIWTDLHGDLAPTQPFYNGWWQDIKTIASAINSGQLPLQSSVLEEDKDAHRRRVKQSKRFGFQTSMRLRVDSGVAMDWVKPAGVSADRLSEALDSVLSISQFVVPDGDTTTVTTDEAREAVLRWVSHFEEADAEVQLPFIQRGFWEGWAAIRMETMGLIRQYMAKYPDLDIHFVGHSLGGAFATLAIIETLWEYELSEQVQLDGRIRLVTYGKPRIGNLPWAQMVLKSKAYIHTRRIVNHADIIPHLPPFSRGFFHLPGEVWLCWTDSTTYRAHDGYDVEGRGANMENLIGLTPFHHFLSSYFYSQEWLIDPVPRPRARLISEARLEFQRGMEEIEDAAVYVYKHWGVGKGVVSALDSVESGATFVSQDILTLPIVKEVEDDVLQVGSSLSGFAHRIKNVAHTVEEWVEKEVKDVLDADG